jgi:8-oxo-dGTP pyrophosphatase MutT (NUDIX family)
MHPHKHCHYCGTKYASKDYPFTCPNPECGKKVWLNLLPVIVVAVPVIRLLEDDAPKFVGVLGVRRAIHPVGELCLPGGYMEKHQTWQEAAIAEVVQETGVNIKTLTFRGIETVDGFIVVFCASEGIVESTIDFSFTSDETQEVVVIEAPTKLAFNVQTEYLKQVFNV